MLKCKYCLTNTPCRDWCETIQQKKKPYEVEKERFMNEANLYLKELSDELFLKKREMSNIELDIGVAWNKPLDIWWCLACDDEYKRRFPPAIKAKSEKKAVWITIQDWKRRKSDIPDMKLFLSRMAYHYKDFRWCIEKGSKENYHIHYLCIIKNSKNHLRALKTEWSKLFNTEVGNKKNDFYLAKQWNLSESMPPYDQWIQEKLEYMDDNKKGEHSNSTDIAQNGGAGFESYAEGAGGA